MTRLLFIILLTTLYHLHIHTLEVPHYTSFLRRGGLVESRKDILLVEDVVTVRIKTDNIATILTQITTYTESLTNLSNTLEFLKEQPDFESLSWFTSVRINCDFCIRQLQAIYDFFPWTKFKELRRGMKRKKRGLFDLGGSVLGKVFGLATEDDIRNVNDQIGAVTDVVNNNAHLVQQQNVVIESLVDRHNKVVERLNVITGITQSINHQINVLPFLMVQLQSLQVSLSHLYSTLSKVFNMFQQVTHGIVSVDLFDPHQLSQIIDWAHRNLTLTPLFRAEQIRHYYPCLEAFLGKNSIFIHIPFKSRDNFRSFVFYPFPTTLNNSLFTLSLAHNFILLSEDLLHISFPPPDYLENCHVQIENIKLCPAPDITVLPIQAFPCEAAVVRNFSTLSVCAYQPLNSSTFFHHHLPPYQFFYFLNSTSVTVSCSDRKPFSIVVKGSYVAPDSCEIISDTFRTFPNRHHRVYHDNLPSYMIHLPEPRNTTVPQVRILSSQLYPMSKLNVSLENPVFEDGIHPYVIYPYLSGLTIVSIVVIIGIFVLCYFLKRRYSEFRQIVLQQITSTTINE